MTALFAGLSTSTNLAANGVFTSPAVEWSAYGSATVTVFSSHASATNGLSVQQSMDGANWDITDTYTVSAASKTSVVVPRQGLYFRVVYTNGATLTTSLRLQTFINDWQSRAVSARPGDAMTIENDYDQSISLQATYNGTTADMARSVTNGGNTIGTGIAAAGLMAQLDDTSPTTITENQFGNLRIAPNRALLVKQDASTADSWSYAAAAGGIVNTTTAVTFKAAGAAGIRNYLKSITLSSDALGAVTEIAIRDGAAGTVLWRSKLQTAALPVTTLFFEPPLKGTAATLMEVVTLTASVTGGVFVNAQGFVGP